MTLHKEEQKMNAVYLEFITAMHKRARILSYGVFRYTDYIRLREHIYFHIQ